VIRDDVLDFIRRYIKTIWSLELLLLVRSDTQRAWTAGDLVKELRSSHKIVSEALSVFVQAGILRETDAGFLFAPVTSKFEELIGELGREFAERPSSVINAIVEAPSSKLQDFANAFRIKRD